MSKLQFNKQIVIYVLFPLLKLSFNFSFDYLIHVIYLL